jgi:hypothetical protein
MFMIENHYKHDPLYNILKCYKVKKECKNQFLLNVVGTKYTCFQIDVAPYTFLFHFDNQHLLLIDILPPPICHHLHVHF